MDVCELTFDDLDVACRIIVAAYNMPSTARPELRRNLMLQPEGWLLARLDGDPVGLGGAMKFGSFAYIALISVLPSMQHRGVGSALMENLLLNAENRGCTTLLLDSTDAGIPLYTRFGFAEDDKTLLFHRDAASSVLTKDSDLITTMRPADIPALVKFDALYFGADRRAVFASYLADYPQHAFLLRNDSKQIIGYLFAQARNLGPWIAATKDDAELLLAHALSLPAVVADGCNIIVSATNTDAIELAQYYGFTQQRTLSHMRYGLETDFRQRTAIYGQASFALG